MSRAFDDYYIEDCGVILASEVTQRRIDNRDQFIILATVRHMWNVLSNDETIQIVAYIEVCMILMVAM
ncbi:putative protein phosphatase 2C 33 [Zea mays]|uniref:protein-serine/threonine phosphatase n=1 Tax=Zea mays TaxID=4577 RepID=A0A1D6JLA5_MAIZE|nr:putative protein phosphatase 2C 33 [Zea mays]